jgi:hypothetical protein
MHDERIDEILRGYRECAADGEGEPAAGNAAGSETPNDTNVQSAQELLTTKAQLEATQRQLEQLQGALTNPEYIKMVLGVQKPNEEEKPEPEPDVDNMTPKELIAYLRAEMKKESSKANQETSARVADINAKLEVAELLKNHPDAIQYVREMAAYSKQKESRGQQVSALEAYYYIRGHMEDAKKATQATTKKESPTTTESERKNSPKPSGEKPGIEPSSTTARSMTLADAIEAAARDVGLRKR